VVFITPLRRLWQLSDGSKMTFVMFLLLAVFFLFISFKDLYSLVKVKNFVNGEEKVQYLLASRLYENPQT
jgi:hypothetical protein